MKKKEMDKLINHFEYYFDQECNNVYHDVSNRDLHIDILIFAPNDKYPFYKLVTMGASDYSMPKIPSTLSNRNEYMLFLSKQIDLKSDEFQWHLNFLSYMARYAYYENTHISVGHVIDLLPNFHPIFKSGFVLFPQIVEDSFILRCQLGMFKTCTCLEVLPITSQEVTLHLNEGPKKLHDYFYPENGEPIFLADRD